MTTCKKAFSNATSKKSGWREAVAELSLKLSDSKGSLGILYTSEEYAPNLGDMIDELRINTEILSWVSAAGYGTISDLGEFYGDSTSTAIILDLPPDSFRLFSGGPQIGVELLKEEQTWIEKAVMPLAITHADPRSPRMADAIQNLAETTNSYLIGGLTVASSDSPHISNKEGDNLSGVLISPEMVEVATGLSQGCTPISNAHTITKSEQNIIIELDQRPAFDVFLEAIGEEFNDNLREVAGLIFVAFPIPGSDTADYTVRNLIGLDPQNKVLAIAEIAVEGEQVLFCRRDRESAVRDMHRMSADLKNRIGNKYIRGGIYITCAARGPNQFAPPERELDIIRENLGDFPIAGFFANGEISRDKVYAYTGILTLFL